MITIEQTISNDGVEAARKEIQAFLKAEDRRMAKHKNEAALGYVVLRRFLELIEQADRARLARIREEEREAKREEMDAKSTVRERRDR